MGGKGQDVPRVGLFADLLKTWPCFHAGSDILFFISYTELSRENNYSMLINGKETFPAPLQQAYIL